MSAAMDDDYPMDLHLLSCTVWSSDAPCDCGADSISHPSDRFQVGYADSRPHYPIDDPLEDLLRPDAGTLADRLEDLGRRIYPRDTDGVA